MATMAFDANYYLAQYQDVREAVAANKITAEQHWNLYGCKEERNPNAEFNTAYYAAHNTDVVASGMNYLDHYLKYGSAEAVAGKRLPNSSWETIDLTKFDKAAYLSSNPDVKASGMDALQHYMLYGRFEASRDGTAKLTDGTVVTTPTVVTPVPTFTLTAGLDFADTSSAFMNGTIPSNFKFTAANEKVQALDGTLNNTDVLQDGNTTDADVLEIRVATAGNLTVAPTVKNIENINVVMTNPAAAGTLSLLNFTGAKTVTLTGSATTAGVNNFADAGVTTVDASAVTAGAITITPTANTTNALTLLGGAGADVISGSAGNDKISGGAGADILNGGAGNNTINGDAGNDIITAGNGDNTINGGNGDDTVTVGSGKNTIDMGAGATEILTAGNGDNTVTSAGTTLSNITLGSGANTVTISGSGASAITINGNGANTVTGGSGIDTVAIAGSGSNTITTGAGADVITITAATGTATNTITAGAGADTITLAVSATIVDKLVFGATDSGAMLATADKVTGFQNGVDTLNFNLVAGDSVNYVADAGAAAATYAAALTAADAFFAGATGAAAGVRYYVTDATDSDGAANAGAIVFIDRNGDGSSDQSVVLIGQTEATLTYNDIIG